jgi:hypothetical protein
MATDVPFNGIVQKWVPFLTIVGFLLVQSITIAVYVKGIADDTSFLLRETQIIVAREDAVDLRLRTVEISETRIQELGRRIDEMARRIDNINDALNSQRRR